MQLETLQVEHIASLQSCYWFQYGVRLLIEHICSLWENLSLSRCIIFTSFPKYKSYVATVSPFHLLLQSASRTKYTFMKEKALVKVRERVVISFNIIIQSVNHLSSFPFSHMGGWQSLSVRFDVLHHLQFPWNMNNKYKHRVINHLHN